jgi:hypothetical protein
VYKDNEDKAFVKICLEILNEAELAKFVDKTPNWDSDQDC